MLQGTGATARSVVFKRAAIALVGASLALGMTACGGDDEPATGGSGAAAQTSGGDAKLTAFNAKVDALVEERSKEQKPAVPTTGSKPKPGRKIVIVSCSQQAEGCRRNSQTAADAAKIAGWTSTVVDAAGDPTKMAAGVRQAIDTKATGLVMVGIDTAFIPDVLQQAKDAGLGMVCWVCGNDPDLYDDVVTPTKTYAEDGYLATAAAYQMQDYKLHTLNMEENAFVIDRDRGVGARRFVEECEAAGGDCKLLGSAEFALTDLTTSAPQKAVNLVRTKPGANVFWSAFDAAATFQFQALEQANLTEGMIGVGFDANEANLDDIRSDGFQRITVGLPAKAAGFAFIDNLIRLDNGEKVVDQGVQTKLLTKENLPAEGAWDGDFDVEPLYRKLWGK